MSTSRLAVALHDVMPSTFERCVVARDWLAERGVERATLLVVPAEGCAQFQDRSPDMVPWLHARREAGDAIAQHGFRHALLRPGCFPRGSWGRLVGRAAAEFTVLDSEESRSTLDAGRRVMARAGLEPRGFVAPGYAYTPQLRVELAAAGYSWWSGLLSVTARRRGGHERVLSPALCLGASTLPRRLTSRPLVAGLSRGTRRLWRLDVHPADFDHARHVAALDRLLDRASDRTSVNYDRLAAG